MVRAILGAVVGTIAAFATIALVEWAGALLYPQPAPVDWTGQVVVADWVRAMPIGAKLVVVGGWLLGAMAGAVIAGLIARHAPIGWVPAGLVVIGGIANITMIPHPMGMAVAALVAPVAGGWIGVRLARGRAAHGAGGREGRPSPK